MRCSLSGIDVRPVTYLRRGLQPQFQSPAYLYAECQGRECYERDHIARERSCVEVLDLRTDPPPAR